MIEGRLTHSVVMGSIVSVALRTLSGMVDCWFFDGDRAQQGLRHVGGQVSQRISILCKQYMYIGQNVLKGLK